MRDWLKNVISKAVVRAAGWRVNGGGSRRRQGSHIYAQPPLKRSKNRAVFLPRCSALVPQLASDEANTIWLPPHFSLLSLHTQEKARQSDEQQRLCMRIPLQAPVSSHTLAGAYAQRVGLPGHSWPRRDARAARAVSSRAEQISFLRDMTGGMRDQCSGRQEADVNTTAATREKGNAVTAGG